MTWLKAWDEIIRRRQNENRILKYGLSFVLESPRMRVFKQPVSLGSSKEALVNADLNGQIKGGKIIGGMLTSEDLW